MHLLHSVQNVHSVLGYNSFAIVVNAQGRTVQPSGILPTLQFENIAWPEFQNFSIDNILRGQNGDIHYSFYLPDDCDSAKRYPMIVVLPGYNGMLLSLDEETVGVNLFTDRS